jgi:hypothetical protein
MQFCCCYVIKNQILQNYHIRFITKIKLFETVVRLGDNSDIYVHPHGLFCGCLLIAVNLVARATDVVLVAEKRIPF